jgi:predicted porin
MIRRIPVVLIAITLAGAVEPAAAADALSNSYWDAAYVNSKTESGSVTLDDEGFRLGLGIGLAKFLSITGDYDQVRHPDTREGFGSAGLAYHTQNPVYQFHGAVTYERYEFDDNTNSAGDSQEEGYGVEVGARYALENVELHAAYRYLDFGDLAHTDTGFKGSRYGLGADLQLSPWWSLVADYRVRQHKFDVSGPASKTDYTEWTVGFRHYFATDPDRLNRHGGLLNGLFSE